MLDEEEAAKEFVWNFLLQDLLFLQQKRLHEEHMLPVVIHMNTRKYELNSVLKIVGLTRINTGITILDLNFTNL